MKSLTVYTVGDLRYGIAEDREPLAIDIRDIHWLPPVSPHIAGITVVDEHTVTLLDLRACLGLPPMPRNRRKYLLLRTGGGDSCPAALVLPDSVGRSTITANPDAVLPLPDFLASPVMRDYTLSDSKPVLIIDAPELFRQAQAVEFAPPQSRFAVPADAAADETDCDYTLIDTADRSFAVADTWIASSGTRGAVSHPFLPAPPFVAGVEICEGKPIPLIDLARRLNLETRRIPRLVLDVELDRQRFRLCFDALLPPVTAGEVQRRPLPPLLKNNWRQTALVGSGRIVPILNVAGLLSDQADHLAPAQAYTATSNFPSTFNRQDVDIVEFEICGVRHALAGLEAEPAIGMLPVSTVTNARPLVAGVSEYEGELLPVLDLSRCFGLRADPSAGWAMIPITNGDFKALVLTERSFPPRRLPVDLHRDLPYEHTENFVYGCYPDELVARLIFNVHALAIHFDRARHQQFFQLLAGVTQTGPDLEENPRLQQALFPDDADTAAAACTDASLLTPDETGDLSEEPLARTQAPEPAAPEPQPTESASSPQALLAKRLQKVVLFQPPIKTVGSEADRNESEAPAEVPEEKEDSGAPEETMPAVAGERPYSRTREASPEADTAAPDAGDTAARHLPLTTSGQLPASAAAPGPLPTGDTEGDGDSQEQAPSDGSLEEGNESPLPGDSVPSPVADTDAADAPAGDSDEAAAPEAEEPFDADLSLPETTMETDEPSVVPETVREAPGEPTFEAEEVFGTSDAEGLDEIRDLVENLMADGDSAEQESNEPMPPDEEGFLEDNRLPEEEISIEEEIDPEPEDDRSDEEQELFEIAETLARAQQPSNAMAPAAEDLQDADALLAMAPTSQPGSGRKKVYALFLAALLLIVAAALFSGWRLGWLDWTAPQHAVRHPISDPDGTWPPAATSRRSARAAKPAAKPAKVPVAAAPDPTTEQGGPQPAADPSTETVEQTRTIKIIDKDGRLIVYKVKKGDTLWGISEKYTGTGFNYPKLADDNRIKNPDLIFPRQRIEVK